jgi:hypothetical protein
MNAEPKLNNTEELRVAHRDALHCWRLLEIHANEGRCNCHQSEDGSIHILNACVTGRMLNDEYASRAERLRELSPPINRHGAPDVPDLNKQPLEAGDMESTLEPDHEHGIFS